MATPHSRSHEIMEKSERQLSKHELVDAVMEMLAHDQTAATVEEEEEEKTQVAPAAAEVAELEAKTRAPDDLFHDIHLRPTALKRSHSDPDIKVRDKIWDQLLSTVEQMRQTTDMDAAAAVTAAGGGGGGERQTTDMDAAAAITTGGGGGGGDGSHSNVLVSKSLRNHDRNNALSRRKRSIAHLNGTNLSEFYQEVALSRHSSAKRDSEAKMQADEREGKDEEEDVPEDVPHLSNDSSQLSYVEPEYRGFNLFGYFNRRPHNRSAAGQYDAAAKKGGKKKTSSMKKWMNREEQHTEHPTSTAAAHHRYVGNFDNSTYRRRPRMSANIHDLSRRSAVDGAPAHKRTRMKSRNSKKVQTQQFLNNIHQVF
eukprot:CAMPEP_0202731822 /NCGR_PEP_ID=MMETSP1385-20130828/187347_1 /ASSEMBLY_ACC=CAM_ASM_000861 /TAXON_ID=933848 /ORGANISM="Elphidium margaritaceum" /LENGTH=367 /DNA_ID=CAMNT_0049398125 /DNA_START=45 /DNA_END=1148 /DNA_ORIENTATION=+